VAGVGGAVANGGETSVVVRRAAGRQPVAAARALAPARPEARGKFLFAAGEKLYVRGVTYGAFEPDADGSEYHDLEVVERDFALMAEHGLNAVRIPHTMPPASVLDVAERHGLRVMVGLSAEQYAGYLADSWGRPDIEAIVREKVRSVAGHPALLCYALGNEIPAPVVRWLGRRKVERYLGRLYEAVRDEDEEGLVTYVNYPSTEYLELPFLDLVSFNVYLEARERLQAYLARLHNLAGDRPLLMSELGLDALRNGEDVQAAALDWQIRTAFAGGCAGAFVFAWTDEWFRAGEQVEDWAFGVTRSDRSSKPALERVATAFAETPFPAEREWPRISVVVCTYNGRRTLARCLEALDRLDYPDYEVIVVDDGSTDGSAAIAAELGARTIRTPNGGLSSARNVGAAAATGEIVAYLDDDAFPDPHWLQYLADTFLRTDDAVVGGPNIPPAGSGRVAESVAHAPGGPIHVLLSDVEAEHVPGCNLAVRKSVLEEVGGFDPRFRIAGDDVDFCWRVQESGLRLGFNPAAVVWHERRSSVRAYWRQQRGYGRAEALLERKWPERYNAAGHVSWGGRVYGNAFGRLPSLRRSRVYAGVWGFAPFQSLYQPASGVLDALPRMPEWNIVVALLAGLTALGVAWSPLFLVAPALALALLAPLADASVAAVRAPFGRRPRRLLVRLWTLTALLHLLQPLARLSGRVGYGLAPWRRPRGHGLAPPITRTAAVWTEDWQPPEERLASAERSARRSGLRVRHGGDFDRWDLEVRGGLLGAARLLFAAEDHGAGNQYLRYRIGPSWSRVALGIAAALAGLAAAAGVDGAWAASAVLALAAALLLGGAALECAAATAVLRRAIRTAGGGDGLEQALQARLAAISAPDSEQ
jgi:GT2 family glycosyltransferase